MSGGYEKYVRRIVPRIGAHRDVEALQVVVLPQHAERLRVDGGGAGTSFVNVSRFYARFPPRMPSAELLATLESFQPDVLFIPNFRLLVTPNWPQVLLVHNMEPLAWDGHGDPLRQKIVNAARRMEGRLASRGAARLIAVSQFVAWFLRERWSIPAARVGVVYHGADAPVQPGSVRRPTSIREDPPSPFLFTAVAPRPSRGLEDLIGVLRADERLRLVIAGLADPGYLRYEAKLRDSTRDLADRIVWAGALDVGAMAWCFDRCTTFVMTSRVEACPNVALEALANGCISVAADNPPLPEIFADAALYYRPGDAADLLRALREAASLDRSAAALRARTRASAFDWAVAGDQTVAELAAATNRAPAA
jgi:glycosyltransferase involved in cell wall biosynthesis